MVDLIKKIESNIDIKYLCFSGIVTTDKELNETEICTLIEYLNNKCFKNDIGIIDTQVRSIETKINHCIVPTVFTELEEVIFFAKHRINDSKANILRASPDYIIFREPISEYNIKDIIQVLFSGRHAIAFTNMNTDELVKMVSSVLQKPKYIAKEILNFLII